MPLWSTLFFFKEALPRSEFQLRENVIPEYAKTYDCMLPTLWQMFGEEHVCVCHGQVSRNFWPYSISAVAHFVFIYSMWCVYHICSYVILTIITTNVEQAHKCIPNLHCHYYMSCYRTENATALRFNLHGIITKPLNSYTHAEEKS